MRGSPPERFTGKSGLSRVLLVADVLGLGGVEGQVADGSHDLVDSEGHDCKQDVAAGAGCPTLYLQGRVVDDETSDPSEEESQEEACEILVFRWVNSPLLYCPISIARFRQLVNIFSGKCHIFRKKLLLLRGDVPRRCRLGLPLGRQVGGLPGWSPADRAIPESTGGLPFGLPAAPDFSLLFCPHPPDPLPGGKGETKVISCKGLRPLHPRAEPSAAREKRGEPYARQGACLSCRLPTLTLACFFAPIPPPPSRREGGAQGYFMQGAPPLASPALDRLRHL